MRARELLRENRPLVIAHRGGDGLWPENTMHAFERAAKMGADILETDIHVTADGVPVLIHDPTADRTTDGRGPIKSFTFRELKKLDAGYRRTPDGGKTFPFRGKGITVSSLEEAFAALPDSCWNIDIKHPSFVRPFCRAVLKSGMKDKIIAASFHTVTLWRIRRLLPDAANSAGTGEIAMLLAAGFVSPGLYKPRTSALQIPEHSLGIHILTKRFLNTARRLGLPVHVWSVEETCDMKRLIEMGVDGIVTGFPDRLMTLL